MGTCLKCGSKTEGRSVFCSACLDVMAQYPVKPDTVVHIPHRQPRPEEITDADFEEAAQAAQLAHYRSLIRWLTAIVATLSILLVFSAMMLMKTLEKEQPLPVIGRNYTTSTSGHQP